MARTSPRHARRRALSATALTAAVLTVLAATALPATAAGEEDGRESGGGNKVQVTPRRAQPGDWVDLRVRFCEGDETALAASDAFERDVELRSAARGELAGTARIRPRARPGRYEITVDCQVVVDTGAGAGSVTA